MHGGRSIRGNRNPKPLLQIQRARYIERRHALGLKAPGGRKPGRWWRKAKDQRERSLRMAQDMRDLIPQTEAKPLAEMTPAEKLAHGAELGLDRMIEILSAGDPITPETDPKWARLVGDMADKAVKRYADVQVAALQAQQDKGWEELQARIDEHRKRYPKK